MRVEFEAFEYRQDQTLQPVTMTFEGDEQAGWTVLRHGAESLRLGAGYRLLRSTSCGVCSTDLARAFLPFPLPQVTGHEVVARDDAGRRYAVEINASHHARGISSGCPFCARGLGNHCPERLVLGIHDLPGGFGPWILAPSGALREVPPEIPDDAAVLIEPLAAALNAADSLELADGMTITVLGPRKLGMLVIAALDARRRERNLDLTIVAAARREPLRRLARRLGADLAYDPSTEADKARADTVVDTTGSPAAFELALELARREVHVKSTHGRPAGGLRRLTELVVDELNVRTLDGRTPVALRGRPRPLVGWLAKRPLPASLTRDADVIKAPSALALLERLEADPPPDGLPRVDALIVDDFTQIDQTIRPDSSREVSPVRPRGAILIAGDAGPLANVQLSSSRCGDFSAAIELMLAQPRLLALGEQMITQRFQAAKTPLAFEAARSPDCLKAVVEHGTRKDR